MDSDLFVLDLRFRDDPRYPANKAFLENRETPRATTSFGYGPVVVSQVSGYFGS